MSSIEISPIGSSASNGSATRSTDQAPVTLRQAKCVPFGARGRRRTISIDTRASLNEADGTIDDATHGADATIDDATQVDKSDVTLDSSFDSLVGTLHYSSSDE